MEKRKKFYQDLSDLFKNLDYKVISSIIKKDKLKDKYKNPGCPYDISFQFILERLEHFLRNNNAIWELFIEQRWWEEKKLESIFEDIKNDWNWYW